MNSKKFLVFMASAVFFEIVLLRLIFLTYQGWYVVPAILSFVWFFWQGWFVFQKNGWKNFWLALTVPIIVCLCIIFVRYNFSGNLIMYDFEKRQFIEVKDTVFMIDPRIQKIIDAGEIITIGSKRGGMKIDVEKDNFQISISLTGEIRIKEKEQFLNYLRPQLKPGVSMWIFSYGDLEEIILHILSHGGYLPYLSRDFLPWQLEEKLNEDLTFYFKQKAVVIETHLEIVHMSFWKPPAK